MPGRDYQPMADHARKARCVMLALALIGIADTFSNARTSCTNAVRIHPTKL